MKYENGTTPLLFVPVVWSEEEHEEHQPVRRVDPYQHLTPIFDGCSGESFDSYSKIREYIHTMMN